MAILCVEGSGTPLEKEWRALDVALARIAPTDGDAEAKFDASLYRSSSVARLALEWRERMIFEHRSSTVFGQLATQLYEANAPLDAKIVMLRMSQDELRHTGTCAEVLTALGGDTRVEVDLVVAPLATHAGTSLEERALRNVIYTTCCSELVACARFVATLDRTKDPFIRHAMRRLLADEVLHGQFGFHYLEANRLWLSENPRVLDSVSRYLIHAFAIIETELAPTGMFPRIDDELRALGGDDMNEAREVFYGTIEGAVLPGLERFGITAVSSWKNRQRLV